MRNISDWELNEYYARNYYGAGTNYFEPPEYDDLAELWDDENCDYEYDRWRDEYV